MLAQGGSSVYQLLAGISGALIVAIIALGVAIARTREQVSRLEARLDSLKDDIKELKGGRETK
jgi:cell division protein FtsB